jgi:hypothetical protein
MIVAFGKTVTLVRRSVSGQDADGNDTYAEQSIDRPGCVVEPRNSSELVQGQDLVIVGLTVYDPDPDPYLTTDLVEVDGERYEVDGLPGNYRSPFTATVGPQQVALTKYTG